MNLASKSDKINKTGDYCLVFNNGIVHVKTGEESGLNIHLGDYHVHNENGDNYSEDVENYMNKGEWEELDEERIVYNDKIVIFGLDDFLDKFVTIYENYEFIDDELNA